LTEIDIKRKIYSFCAYQERTVSEVSKKLSGMDLPQDRVEDLVRELIREGFVNESRFVESFVSGKFRLKKWGKIKIRFALKSKGVPATLIQTGLDNIEETEYSQTLSDLIHTKSKSLNEKNPGIRQHKVAKFVIGRGFEPSLVWDLLNKMDW